MYNEDKWILYLTLLLCTTLLTLMILLITYFVFQYKKKQVAHLKLISNLKHDYEHNLLKSELEIQEQTFEHLSREIHDNIGQKLSLAKFQMNRFNSSENSNAIIMIGDVITQLRNLSRSMSSDVVLNCGLIKALENEVEQVSKTEISKIVLRVIGEIIHITPKKELIIFRIIQEAIQNILKHAEALIIELELHYKPDNLQLKISDNGRGFKSEVEKSTGMGLENMRKRTSMLKGIFEIESKIRTGTTITINIPYDEKE